MGEDKAGGGDGGGATILNVASGVVSPQVTFRGTNRQAQQFSHFVLKGRESFFYSSWCIQTRASSLVAAFAGSSPSSFSGPQYGRGAGDWIRSLPEALPLGCAGSLHEPEQRGAELWPRGLSAATF